MHDFKELHLFRRICDLANVLVFRQMDIRRAKHDSGNIKRVARVDVYDTSGRHATNNLGTFRRGITSNRPSAFVDVKIGVSPIALRATGRQP